MSVLVLVEHDGSAIKDATLAAITAAGKLGEVHALVAGNGWDGVAYAAAKIAGVARFCRRAAASQHDLAENVAPVAVKLMEGYDAFVAPATTFGKNIAPRVAALLDVMQVSDIISVEGADTFIRPFYAGNAIATVRSKDAKKVITVRGTAFEKASREGGMARSSLSMRAAMPAPAASSTSRHRKASGPSLPARRSSSRAAARSAAASSSTRCSIRSPTSSAPGSARAAPRSTPAMRPTITRSGRRARSSPPKSISRSVSRARSSTLRE